MKCSASLSCSESAQSRGRPWGRWSVFSESCRCCCPDFSCPNEAAETCERQWAPLHSRRVRVCVHVCANKGNAPLPPPPPLLGVPRWTRFYLIWIIFNSKCEKNKNTFCFIFHGPSWFLVSSVEASQRRKRPEKKSQKCRSGSAVRVKPGGWDGTSPRLTPAAAKIKSNKNKLKWIKYNFIQ